MAAAERAALEEAPDAAPRIIDTKVRTRVWPDGREARSLLDPD